MSLTYFAKNNAGTEELWVSDGTLAGTHLVKAVGTAVLNDLTVIGARAYFGVSDGVHGDELWTSDGTAAGTTLVKDINPGPADSSPFELINLDGALFFRADDGTHGLELWKSDGTAAGTVMVKDILSGASGSMPSFLTDVDGALFFSASDGVHSFEVWKSDGSADGTVLVKDIAPNAGSSDARELVDVNGTLFFQATDGVNGQELWKSDGTADGTMLVKDIFPGIGGSFPSSLTNVNGTLFFSAETTGSTDRELWKSDGTTAGTVLVKDIDPGTASSDPTFLTNMNGTLFFEADDGVHGIELWKSDGTVAGTVMVKDINPGPSDSLSQILTNVNGTLFFVANDGVHGRELWKTDGTDAGTVLVKDINTGMGDSNPIDLINVNGALEFLAFDGSSEGLFRSDGTAAGTIELTTNVDSSVRMLGFAPPPRSLNFNGDSTSDILWRNSNGTLAGWSLHGGVISASGFLASGGVVARPDASWSVAGISDFNGDGRADVLWRNANGTLADWTMNGSTIAASGTLNLGGIAVRPDASWSVAGAGDFDGDGRSDILWRGANGTLADWSMNGPTIMSSGFVTTGGSIVTPDASWSVAGVADFDGDGRSDILWRNAFGEVTVWLMNGSKIAGSGDITFGGTAPRPDPSWSIAGVGDFNHDGKSDLLWQSTNGSLAMWLMNGTTIASSGFVTFNGSAIAPDASWRVVEIGDFNGDSNADILWRNNNGALAEWLMNGNAIAQSLAPTSNGAMVSPDASWSTQAKPTISA